MSETPLYDAYRNFLANAGTPFTVPGHKRNPDLIDDFLAFDVPHYGGVENRRASTKRLATAERLAGELWGADWCGFSVQGSSHGNEAICLSLGKPGDKVVVARTIHKSLFFGIVLAGLVPVWIRPDVDEQTGLTAGMPVSRVAEALAQHPDAKAVMLVEPSYVGGVSDVAAHAELAHAHGIPLTVDAAWGAHLGFHPDLPPHAIAAGADVLVTSIHKHITGFTQSSMVLAQGERIDLERLDAAFEDCTPRVHPVPFWPASIWPAPCWPTAAQSCSTKPSDWRTKPGSVFGRFRVWASSAAKSPTAHRLY